MTGIVSGSDPESLGEITRRASLAGMMAALCAVAMLPAQSAPKSCVPTWTTAQQLLPVLRGQPDRVVPASNLPASFSDHGPDGYHISLGGRRDRVEPSNTLNAEPLENRRGASGLAAGRVTVRSLPDRSNIGVMPRSTRKKDVLFCFLTFVRDGT